MPGSTDWSPRKLLRAWAAFGRSILWMTVQRKPRTEPRSSGTTHDLVELSQGYANVVVAIGNPEARQKLICFIEEETLLRLVPLVSPRAYVSPSAQIGKGCIVEPMAVVHTGCVLGKGCLICAGAVVNHGAMCGDCVQVDCNAVVPGNIVVQSGVKVNAGTVYEKKIPHCPVSVDGSEFRVEDDK